jgi:hypothetical protein
VRPGNANTEQNMPDSPAERAFQLATEVYFVTPDALLPSGFRSLGHYPMVVPPRQGETVTICDGLGGDVRRFHVYAVIHHMPPHATVSDRQPDQSMIAECTCVLATQVSAEDVNRAIVGLCQTDHRRHREMFG